MFRINRDIRFAKDKTPYNVHVSAGISPTGKNMEYPGMYLHLNIDTSHFGGGCYMPSKENLHKMRQFIIDHPTDVQNALANKAFTQTFKTLEPGEKNKILPKEFKSFGEKQPLLFNKQFYYMADYPGEATILRKDLLSFIVNHYKAGSSWNELLKRAMF